jgi:hypothetical protein
LPGQAAAAAFQYLRVMTSAASEDDWTVFAALVATTHPVSKYGGFQLSEQNLEQMVAALSSGKLPMLGHHDWSKPVRTRNVLASVVTLEDGEKGVRLECEVQSQDLDAVGEIGGMSFTTFAPLGRVEGPHVGQPDLRLSADAAAFSEADIARASELMAEIAPVEARLLFQFNALETARFVLELGYIVVLTLGPNLAASAIWDGVRHLIIHRRHSPELGAKTRIEMVTPLSDGREVIGLIDTNDPETARLALRTYARSVEIAAGANEPRVVIQWQAEHQEWDNGSSGGTQEPS